MKLTAWKSQQVPMSLISGALGSFALLWYAALAGIVRDNLGRAPLFWFLMFCLCPLACLVVGFALVRGRSRLRAKFSALDWCSIVLASGPILYLGLQSWFIIMSLLDYFRG
jgi:hypothetical protein